MKSLILAAALFAGFAPVAHADSESYPTPVAGPIRVETPANNPGTGCPAGYERVYDVGYGRYVCVPASPKGSEGQH